MSMAYTIKQLREKEMKNFKPQDLKTGVILLLKDFQDKKKYAMLLRNTANGDLFSGETWGDANLDNFPNISSGTEVLEIWQPRSNMAYLNEKVGLHLEDVGVNTEGCDRIWKKEIKIAVDVAGTRYLIEEALIKELLNKHGV